MSSLDMRTSKLPVIQYDINHNEVNRYADVYEVREKTGYDTKGVREACRYFRMAHGYYWGFVGGDFELTSNGI